MFHSSLNVWGQICRHISGLLCVYFNSDAKADTNELIPFLHVQYDLVELFLGIYKNLTTTNERTMKSDVTVAAIYK